jgi:Anti-sigma-D factor RsdA to sigma factor binding region
MSESTHSPFDQPGLGAVARTERFIDALAKREPIDVGDVAEHGDRALAGLLEDWRDELRAPGSRGFCPERDVVAALDRGRQDRRRIHRRMVLVGTLAATLLSVGGFVAMMGEAKPGDTLYGVHTRVLGEPVSVHDERIARSAQNDMDSVEEMIALGQWDQAQDKLAAVSDRVQTVKDNDRKQDLVERVNVLNAKVANRDPHATTVPSQQPNSVGSVGG